MSASTSRWVGCTSDAEALARRSARRITLIDGAALLELWVEYYGRLDEDGRQLLPIKPVHYLDLGPSSG